MSRRRSKRTLPRIGTLVRAAFTAYLANCALGLAVRVRVLDTRGHRWVHHALYILTSTLTGLALTTGWMRGAPATRVLAPAVLPLAVLPRARRHASVALAAAPFYLAAVAADAR